MKAYHLYLLRHGLTQGNREGRYIGRTDAPLSPEGEAELAGLRRRFIYPKAELYFSSPMRRCVSTLTMLYPGEDYRTVDGLRECDFGEYENRTIEELRDDPAYANWVAGAGRTAPPGGESSVEFQRRTCEAFEKIVDTLLHTGKNSAVVMAHGGTIMSILARYAFPRRAFYEWMTKNASGYEVLVTPQLWMSARAMEVAGRIPFEPDAEGPEMENRKSDA